MEYPTVHMNGTSADVLIEGYTDAMETIRQAISKLEECSPNGRDHYIENNFSGAMAEHAQRLACLAGVREQLYLLAQHVDDGHC